MQTESAPVVIVGGSLVGLSTAMFLAHRGVQTIVLEKHIGSALHPRAMGYTPRTMEAFRTVGIAHKVPQMDPNFRLRRIKVESMEGKWFSETEWTPQGKKPDQKPQPKIEYSLYPIGAAVAQDKLEPILRERAIELGADLRQGVEFISFEQDNEGVTILARERKSGKEYSIQAQYLIATDGSKSAIRETLGIDRKGRGQMRTITSVLFRAPIDDYLKSGFAQFEIEQEGLKAFLTTYGDGRWVLLFTDDIERTDEELIKCIHKAIGKENLEIDIITTGRWDLSALICNKYSSGRVFLAGDSAHTLPPTRGGFGANTGIDDGFNLAWKLEAVLSGKSSPKLLETYSDERQPIGWLRHQQTFARPDYAHEAQGIADGVAILPAEAVELGQLYRSASIIGAGEDLAPAMKPDEWTGQPGTRAQHFKVTRDEQEISTLDLFPKGWTLLSESRDWEAVVASVSDKTGIPIEFIHVGSDVKFADDDIFETSFGIGPSGASLVRPDQYIAWRSVDIPNGAENTLLEVVNQVACPAKSK
ncbi:hypothetical protein INT43_001652 [Umbelopsis isabellina]|uniref:FAD-binding domain-containing protein n=1 Tax=Mortierella isabellina TaxID=91625 RepID=A0A8H7UAW7_MORIS|nr:hypothetical protein INT43_001652 [Umbelopsis isabellina]